MSPCSAVWIGCSRNIWCFDLFVQKHIHEWRTATKSLQQECYTRAIAREDPGVCSRTRLGSSGHRDIS